MQTKGKFDGPIFGGGGGWGGDYMGDLYSGGKILQFAIC